MFVCLSVCLSVNSFSVKDFSATTWVRILKFGAKLDNDKLYCVTKEQPHIVYQSFYLFIFLPLQWKFLSQISQLLLEPVFFFLNPRYEVYRGYIVFVFSVIMFVCLSVCLSVNFFSVKDFSATTWVRILKFGTKLDNDELYCVTKEQPHIVYQSLYLFIFLSLQWKFLSQISQLLLEPVFSNFVYIFRMAKCTV